MPISPASPAATVACLAAAMLLSGCAADPLADVPKLSEVAVAGPVPVVEAVAAPEEISETTGFLARLLRKREIAPAPAPEPAAPNPAPEPAATEPAPAPAPTEAAAAPDRPERRGFRLFGRKRQAAQDGPAAIAATQTPATDPAPAAAATEPETGTRTDAATLRPEPGKRGLFGLFRQSPQPEPGPAPTDAVVTPAALQDPATAPAASETRARKGLFGGGKSAALTAPAPAPRNGADAREAAPGEQLPFGEVARACHVKRGEMGREVARYPERGAKYRVYDSAPGNLGLHSFYVTGFADGCPRQTTAALVVLGTVSMYEALRYGLPDRARSRKPTDKAYESLKARLCGVARNQPCGARIGRIEDHTVFLSLYDRFEDAQGWRNVLLSEGRVVAKDFDG